MAGVRRTCHGWVPSASLFCLSTACSHPPTCEMERNPDGWFPLMRNRQDNEGMWRKALHAGIAEAGSDD